MNLPLSHVSTGTVHRRFRSFFGASPKFVSQAWDRIRRKLKAGANLKHLLWVLFFLKNYDVEHVNAAVANVDEKTFRRWFWQFVMLLSELNMVCPLRSIF